ncbi:hypothetical protein J7T55_009399 [Diaporthe amygdali]|uniref:uncharacterized protein n=1 Tax=Phomopsis amygdali TaxID=1214568 RepID=UPI0022FF16DE|nr:uncharacterized protein J7T55_009399 [Diaporthe amygdali]KAJ0107434.1 hypothetical protein J7T55_009399 [Diaporthe amygdali]
MIQKRTRVMSGRDEMFDGVSVLFYTRIVVLHADVHRYKFPFDSTANQPHLFLVLLDKNLAVAVHRHYSLALYQIESRNGGDKQQLGENSR